MDINSIKRNYGILGKSIDLNRAIDIAVQVSSTDITTLVTGESGCLLYTSPSPRDLP